MSEVFKIELDKKWWAEFRRQTKAAAGDLADVKDLLQRTGEPVAREWRQRLPGSLKRTVRTMRQSRQGIVRAGFRSPHGDHPFLPWLEFGGGVTWYRKPAYGPFKRVPIYGFRMRKVMSLDRGRVPEGRWRQPALEASIDEADRVFADGVQQILNKHFHAPA